MVLPESVFAPISVEDGACDFCSAIHLTVTFATRGWACDSCLRMGLKTGVIL